MTAIRMSFVMGMENKGIMTVPQEPLVMCVVKICEAHLLLAHVRQLSMQRILAFTLYSIWSASASTWLDHWLLRYGLCAALLYFSISKFTAAISLRDTLRSYLLIPFEDRSHERMAASIESFLCAILSMCLAGWLSWYKVCTIAIID
jgi:hypothetical protein